MEQDEDGFMRIMPRRALGEGHWDKRLKERMVELSISDNYDDAKHEWIVTENVWYIPFGEDARMVLTDVHVNGDELRAHPHECLCGHPIVWHFEIENTENGERNIVGSEHIESYMVIRYFESKGYDPTEVTEEMIEEWINEKVKSLKAQWWWDLHGDQFTEWFEEVRELDLRVNQRRTTRYRWDAATRRNEPIMAVRKRSEGQFGQSGYKMASIVWRWNHPDNTKRQIETRGYPNERLWNDLQIFYITQQQYRQQVEQEDAAIAQRIEQLAEQDRENARRQAERAAKQAAEREEYRLRKEERSIREAELASIKEQKRIDKVIAERMNLQNANEDFKDMCEYFDIPLFTPNMGQSDWDRRFLTDMIRIMSQGKIVSDRQVERIRNIILDTPLPATDKQIWYIKKLGGEDYHYPPDININEASELIKHLKGEEE